MKILIYGAGVLGSALAHVLIAAGQDVTMLARGKRAEQLERNGLVVRHYLQRKTTTDRPAVIRVLEPDDRYDLIFTVLKYSDIDGVLPTLAANVSRHIVMVGNNPDANSTREALKRLGGPDKNPAFGFQVSAGTRQEDGEIVSIQLGGGQMLVGMTEGEILFLPLLRQAFAGTRYKVTTQPNMDAWLKNHIVPIVPLNAAVLIRKGDVKALAGDRKLLRRAVNAMGEGFDVLEKAGYPPVPAGQARLIRRHKRVVSVLLGLYHRLPAARWVDGSFAEIEALDRVSRQWKSRTGQPVSEWDALIEEAGSADTARSWSGMKTAAQQK